MAQLRRVLMMVRDVPSASRFYSEGLGLPVIASSSAFAELLLNNETSLAITQATSEAVATTGYSPFLTFSIGDLNQSIYRLLSMGGILDGAIKYQLHGKIAVLRAPDGHMIGLYEPAASQAPPAESQSPAD